MGVPADCVIGVDLGGTKLLVGAVSRDLRVLQRVRRPVPGAGPKELLDAIVAAVEEIRYGAAATAAVRAVGFGIPCLVDRLDGVAISSVHLPLQGVPFAAIMSERLGLPAFVDNDANLALVSEHRNGAARGSGNAIMLTLGTGIGGAILIDGELYRGSRGAAGELGHMVVSADGPDCGPGCPSRGCLEAFASGTALAREAHRAAAEHPDSGLGRALAAGEAVDGRLVSRLAADGDPLAEAVIADLGRWLGIGLVNLLNIFDPDVAVVGGGVSAAGERLLRPARAVVAERALGVPGRHTRIIAAHHGAESGMLGAAVLAYDSLDAAAAA